jgi:phosphinothricin acetyltransferase
MIRRPLETDAARIGEIYNQAIEDKLFATCDIKPVTVESRLEWLASHQEPFPAFVYDDDNHGVVGWSALNKFSVRSSLPTVAELSVYVEREFRSKLVGGRLFMHTIKEAKRLGFQSLVSLTLERNAPSIRGLEAVGFRRAACLEEVARLYDEWVNVVWLQKELAGDWSRELNAFMQRLSEESADSAAV